MEKFKVSFSADDQQLRALGTKHASDTYADIEATFILGNRWTDMDSVSAIWWNDFTKVTTVLDSQGKCIVPHEVLTRKGCVRVNLVGSIVEGDELVTRLTSYSAEAVQVNEKIKLTGTETSEITPSQYEQFVANVKADADRAEAGADEAEASAQSASESATASANSATSSAQSATASAQSAQNASESAISAENAKDDAEDARDEILGMRATAETLEAGSDATASYSDGLLTLGIPRGDKGEQGIQGDTGATPNFSIGEVDTLEPNESATATITGTAENPVLNLGIPKGEQGDVSLEQLEALLPTETASGEIVTITDGQSVVPAKSLKVTLEPIQDLNGYDKPWSAGAGTNKWDEEWETYGSSQIKSKNLIPLIAGATYYLKVPAGIGGTIYFKEDVDIPSSSSWSGANETFTVPSNIHYGIFYAGSGYGTTYNHDIAINYPSTVTTYSPYSNICPISGRTECVTSVSGVNVWDEEWEEGTIDTNGNNSSSTTRWRTKNYISIKPNTQYYFKGTKTGSGTASIRPRFYDADKVYIGNTSQSGTDITANTVFTTPTNAYYMRFTPDKSGTYGILTDEVSINYPSTDHEYHAYNGNTYTTSLGRTVYGGTLDVVSGELVVDRAMVDLGTLNWIYDSSSFPSWAFFYTSDLADVRKPSWNSLVCSNYPLTSSVYARTEDFVMNGTAYRGARPVNIRDSRYTDATSFKTAMDGVQLVYELATPQTIQLTPQEVELLTGTNNVWGDGNVTLVYSADIQRYIEKKLNGNSTNSMLTMARPMTAERTDAESESVDTNSVDTAQVGDDL